MKIMPVNLRGKHFLTLKDFTPEEIRYMLDLSLDLKRKKTCRYQRKSSGWTQYSSSFRESFYQKPDVLLKTAAFDEGGNVNLSDKQSNGQKGVHRRYGKGSGPFFYDGIEFRGFKTEKR